ncbi:tetratricopeptide repeat-containing sensor histidine kinase [Algoriphagus terrigena]|uniref:tetratricopeptide repeat-containing sensor histidine kinase n=1 Tax=Algoriphagus terrigena TaxID=344884 RepID=UPI00040F6183|nr:tetratricopeptide repeat-containing sensor histidine kinase [Algoriphagus terrigena]
MHIYSIPNFHPTIALMLLALLSFWTGLQSPQTFPDSIRNVIATTESDSTKAVLYLDLAKHYYGFEQDTAILYAQTSIQLAERLGLEKIKGNALNIMGVAQLISSDYEEALKTHLKALKIRQSLQDSTGMLESNLNIGNVYYRNGEMGKAAGMYETALIFGIATKNLRGQSMIYNNLGNYYKDLWSQTQKKEDLEEALNYLHESLRIKEELKDYNGLVKTLTQLSQLSLDDREMAKGYLVRALSIADASQDTENKLAVLHELSNYYLTEKNFALAEEYALQAYRTAKVAGSHFYISISSEYLIEAALGQNNFKKAYDYLVVKNEADKAVFNDNRQKIREELLIQYESEKKELENQRLIQEQEYLDLSLQRRNELLLGTGILLAVLGALFWIQKRNHRALRLAHNQLEEAHLLATNQNTQIIEQADRLHTTNLELTEANRFRDKIFSVISHDLRAPFSSLHSIIQLWDKKILSEEELFEVMPLVARETNSLSLMLNNLLMWAHSQLGSDKVQLTTFDLGALVEESTSLLKSQASQKNLNLSQEFKTGMMVNSDRERLSFIVRNILMNAIKFTPSEGKITVDYPTDSEIRITDTGTGMPQEMISKLFSDRVSSQKGTEGESGTGIGLMLSREFAESIGAKILAESEVGTGTTFRILLGKTES